MPARDAQPTAHERDALAAVLSDGGPPNDRLLAMVRRSLTLDRPMTEVDAICETLATRLDRAAQPEDRCPICGSTDITFPIGVTWTRCHTCRASWDAAVLARLADHGATDE